MAKRTVKLLGEPIQNEDDKAAAAITPGMLVNWNGSGDLVPYATAGATGAVAKAFAMEREEMGNDMDVPYAIGDTVKVGVFHSGCRVNALIATGQNIAKGNLLQTGVTGTLAIFAAGTPVARALEAVNNASGSNARLRVEIL
jgi:hypothetical protein